MTTAENTYNDNMNIKLETEYKNDSDIKKDDKQKKVLETEPPNSDSNSEPESDSDSEFDQKDNELIIKSGSEKYVVSQNYIPLFFCNTHEEAKKFMWMLARQHKRRLFDSNIFIYEGLCENEISLSTKYKFFIVPYEKEICRLHINSIFEATEKQESTNDQNDTDKQSETNINTEEEKNTSWHLFSS